MGKCAKNRQTWRKMLEEEGRWELFHLVNRESPNAARIFQVLELKCQLRHFLAVI